jgi:hypothetical protein
MSMLTLLSLLSTASAQDTGAEASTYGFDAHGFRYVTADPDPRSPLRFYRPSDIPALGWSVGAVGEYASRPLLFESEDGTRFPASSNLAAVNVAAGFSPVAGLRFDVAAPVVLTNTFGAAPTGTAYATASGGPTLGDLRVSAVGAPLRPGGNGVGAGLVAALDLPTGDPERWVGTRGPAGLVAALGTLEADDLTVSAQLGARLAPNTRAEDRPAPTLGGDTFEAAGGLGYLVTDGFGVGLEATASVPLDAAVRAALSVPAEVTLTGKYRADSGANVTAGLGVGLGAGAGASPFRLVVGGGFGAAVETTPKDSDLDGFADRDDPCPLDPETSNGFKDDDGCGDALPRVVIEPKLGTEMPADAMVEVTTAAGVATTSTGRTTVEGLPGAKLEVVVRSGACHVGRAPVVVPAEGETTTTVLLARSEASVLVSVFDATGLPLEGAQVRYIIEEVACRPADAALKAGRGTHVMGTGPVKMFVTAPGYDVFQGAFTLTEGEQHLTEAKLKPTSVSLKDGRVKTVAPMQFAAGTATLDVRSLTTSQQIASLLLSLEPAPKIEVAAWADGKDAKKLSQQRADAVRDQLVTFGVPAERLTAVGKGALPRDQRDVVVLSVVP